MVMSTPIRTTPRGAYRMISLRVAAYCRVLISRDLDSLWA
jgi:hypothetical protein